MENKFKDELLDKLFSMDLEKIEHEVTNSEIFSLKEWLSYSEERRNSIIVFVEMTQNLKDASKCMPMFDEQTSEYLFKEGTKKVLKRI